MTFRKTTRQLEMWQSDFGKAYTDRNPQSGEEMDSALGAYYAGVKKSDLFRRFLSEERFPSGRVLEVGCNVGAQLEILQRVNPRLELYGIEPQTYALELARKKGSGVRYFHGTAFDIQFDSNFFDVVMTTGLLIHIHPVDLPEALAEIYRCSRRYIFLHEYFSEKPCQIQYNGHDGLLWKMDYTERYLEQFPGLAVVDLLYLRYPDPESAAELVDQVCLLEKKLGL